MASLKKLETKIVATILNALFFGAIYNYELCAVTNDSIMNVTTDHIICNLQVIWLSEKFRRRLNRNNLG